ncbi:MAG: tetraacyldisaccharide 4'-kinase, partial [Pseudomonadota bacterium]
HDKTAGASALKKKWADTNVVIVDDAFQHLKLKRDTDIVLIDSNKGFKDKVFPYGMLRESYSSLKRADIILFTKSDKLNEAEKDGLKAKALKIHPGLKVFFSVTELHTSKDVKDKKILPVCAIYNPRHFLDKLIAAGGIFEKYFAYGDHHRFRNSDVKNILRLKESVGAEYIVATSKDMPKLREFFKGRADVVEAWYEHKINDKEEFLTCCIG